MKFRIRLGGLVISMAAMLVGAMPSFGDESPAGLFMSDFESGVLNNAFTARPSQGWAGIGNMPVITQERVRSGRYAMKAYLNKNTSAVPYRTMLQSKWLTTSDPRFVVSPNVPFFQDSWIGFSVYLPSTGPGSWSSASRTYEIIAQWHDAHFSPIPAWDTEKSKNPLFSLSVSDSGQVPERNWRIGYIGESRTPYPGLDAPRPYLYESFKTKNIGSIEGDLDKWTDWVIRIRWNFWKVGSTNNFANWDANSEYRKRPGTLENIAGSATAGLIQVWKNGVLVFSESPVQIGSNDNTGPGFSVGLYKGWATQADRDKDPITDRVVYFDEFRYAGDGAGYADVAPANRFIKTPSPPTGVNIR